MVAKRLLAVLVAAGLIVAAVLIRGQVIDGDDEPASAEPTTLVCAPDLASLCNAAASTPGLTTRTASDATMPLASDEVWLTLAPLPDAVEGYTSEVLASSPLALVLVPDEAEQLRVACPELDWSCIGAQAGRPWASGDGAVRPGVAPIDTAIGQVSVAAVVRGFFANTSIDTTDPAWIPWSRRLSNVVGTISLSGGTPIGTIQVRQSALDVAIGAEAELATTRRDQFTVLYAAPMTRVDLVLAAPDGVDVPDGLVAALSSAAIEAGWEQSAEGQPPSATDLLAAVAAWGAL